MRAGWLVALLTCALAVSIANAGIVTYPSVVADGDGAVDVHGSVWTQLASEAGVPVYQVAVAETMHSSPAHIGTAPNQAIVVDNDPIVWILKTVENGTDFAWTGYHFNVYMDQSFTINAASAPVGWLPTITAAAAGPFADSDGRLWAYKGEVAFAPISPAYNIPSLGSGDFGAKVQFLQNVQFEVEQIAVPEPVSLALLALGGLFIRRNRK